MTVSEILPTLRQLKCADKIRVVQFLVNEIAKEEEILFEPNANYPIWSPLNSDEAAKSLREMLKAEVNND